MTSKHWMPSFLWTYLHTNTIIHLLIISKSLVNEFLALSCNILITNLIKLTCKLTLVSAGNPVGEWDIPCQTETSYSNYCFSTQAVHNGNSFARPTRFLDREHETSWCGYIHSKKYIKTGCTWDISLSFCFQCQSWQFNHQVTRFSEVPWF